MIRLAVFPTVPPPINKDMVTAVVIALSYTASIDHILVALMNKVTSPSPGDLPPPDQHHLPAATYEGGS